MDDWRQVFTKSIAYEESNWKEVLSRSIRCEDTRLWLKYQPKVFESWLIPKHSAYNFKQGNTHSLWFPVLLRQVGPSLPWGISLGSRKLWGLGADSTSSTVCLKRLIIETDLLLLRAKKSTMHLKTLFFAFIRYSAVNLKSLSMNDTKTRALLPVLDIVDHNRYY